MLRSLALLLLPLAVQAGVYKWVDEAGNVHYGDRPDGAAAEVEMNVPVVDSGIDAQRAEDRGKLLDVMREDREALAEQRREAQRQRLARAEKCNRLRSRYDRMKHATGLYQRGESDERKFLSSEQRAALEGRYRKAISRHCR